MTAQPISYLTPENFQKKYVGNPHWLIVGVTGHRDLRPQDKAKIKELVTQQLNSLREQNRTKKLLLCSALAPGADQWVAQCLAKEDKLVVVKTLPDGELKKYTFEIQSPNDPALSAKEDAFDYFTQANQHNERVQLYYDSQRSFTTEERNRQFVQLGRFLSEHCDHLIALWDGVDGGGLGGTSDIVRMWVKGKGLDGKKINRPQQPQTLHQLVVPRQQNHFPIGRRFAQTQLHLPMAGAFEWVTTVLPNHTLPWHKKVTRFWQHHKVWLVLGTVLFGLLIIVDFVKGFDVNDLLPLGFLALLYGGAWRIYHAMDYARPLLLQFVYPTLLAVIVITAGYIGFKNDKTSIGNAFFSAANLITLNSSIFSEGSNITKTLELARILGGFLAGYAFILAFSFAAGKEGFSRIQFFVFRKFLRRLTNTPFTVVVGNGEKALDVVLDVEKRGQRVVMLDEGAHPLVEKLLKNRRVWYLKGDASSSVDLLKTHFHKAAEVYLMSENDEENFRTAQEMDEWMNRTVVKNQERYVHLHDLRLRGLLHQLARRNEQIRTFSVYENTARRLLTRYPIDRFAYGQTVAQVILLGFGKLAREIALTCLRLGHYPAPKCLSIKVYYSIEEQPLVEAFKTEHPELFRNQGVFGDNVLHQEAQSYTFFNHLPAGESPISFEALPPAESDLRNPVFSLYQLIQPHRAVSLYACLDSGIASASMLGMLLPRIQWLKQHQPTQTDVQAFCFYNFPDEEEEAYVETQLNALASYLPVFCFGNFLQECAIQAIRNEAMNQVAKRLAMLYACLYNDKQVFELPQLSWLADCVTEIDEELKEQEWPSYNDQMIEKTHLLLQRLNDFIKTARQNGGEDPSVLWMNELWNSITEDERESNIQAADHAWVKFRQMNQNPLALTASAWEDNELELLGELEHRRWNAEKLTLGWLPFADKALWKSHKQTLKTQKLHHFLMPFDQLPDDERNKDHTQAVGIRYFFEYLFKDVRP